jgi:hypothetical protein
MNRFQNLLNIGLLVTALSGCGQKDVEWMVVQKTFSPTIMRSSSRSIFIGIIPVPQSYLYIDNEDYYLIIEPKVNEKLRGPMYQEFIFVSREVYESDSLFVGAIFKGGRYGLPRFNFPYSRYDMNNVSLH